MVRKRRGVTFTVTGRGPFPLDMLRYDQAAPRTSSAVSLIEERCAVDFTTPQETVAIDLIGYSAQAPTNGRWSSFGWFVSDVTDIV